jgi:hypothetical protein
MQARPQRTVTEHPAAQEARQTFLAATQPFRYVENRWVQLLSSAEPMEPGRDATRSQHRHAFSSDYPARH